MAKVTVYDKQGRPSEVDPVDAREYVASGSYTMENPNADASQQAGAGSDPDADEAARKLREAATSTAGSVEKKSRRGA